MALRNLIIAFNGGEASIRALRCALAIARQSDGHVTGLLAHGTSNLSRGIPNWMPGDLRRAVLDSVEQRAGHIRAIFAETSTGVLPEGRVHWLEIAGEPDRTVADYARMYDLTILGQYENSMSADELELHPPRIGAQSGKPVLVVPKTWSRASVSGHAVIAWDGMRAITRAVSDGLDFLTAASRVSVLTIETQDVGKTLRGIDILTVLDRHGIAAREIRLPRSAQSLAEDITAFCVEESADMLLAGLSSHGLIKSQLLGDTVEGILRRSEIPVLLSH